MVASHSSHYSTRQIYPTTLCIFFITLLFSTLANAVSIPFTNCLNPKLADRTLFFRPTHVDSVYTKGNHSEIQKILTLTITGEMYGAPPDMNSTSERYSTVRTQLDALQFELASDYHKLCEVASSCPFGPGKTEFTITYNLSKAYQGIVLNSKTHLISPTSGGNVFGCVQVEVLPILDGYAWYTIVITIFAVAMFVGFTFLLAAYFNPWTGTKNVYVWSSNFGHDSSVIRLITPGFFDFIKYMQFAVFMASLSLSYPAFYQPIATMFSWSCLLFPSRILAQNQGDLHDGLYTSHSPLGLEALTQINQVAHNDDIWSGYMILLLILTGGVVVFCELVTLGVWLFRKFRNDITDFRSRNISFLIGLFVRIYFNLFAFPLLVWSFFQCLIAGVTPYYFAVLAACVIVAWISVAVFISYTLLNRSRQSMFDNLPTMLKYGTLYNIYNEPGSMFFIVELLTTLFRSVIIGAVQISGLAQIIFLAVTELFYFFSIMIIKPFDKETSMNLYTCAFSGIRFFIIIMSLPFLDSLHVSPIAKQWIGYFIFMVHAIVLLFFFGHGLQVIIEIVTRYYGIKQEHGSCPIYSLKQLSRRRRYCEMIKDRKEEEIPSLHPLSNRMRLDGTTSGDKSPTSTLASSGYGCKGPFSDISFKNEYLYEKETLRSSSTGSERSTVVDTPSGSSFSEGECEFYRKPRRRTDTSETLCRPKDKNLDVSRVTKMSKQYTSKSNVNYAVREADIYYSKAAQYGPKKMPRSKRKQKKIMKQWAAAAAVVKEAEFQAHNLSQLSGDFGSKFDSFIDMRSSSHLPNKPYSFIEVHEDEYDNDEKPNSTNPILFWLKTRRPLFLPKIKTVEEPSIEPTGGFEVLRPLGRPSSTHSASSIEDADEFDEEINDVDHPLESESIIHSLDQPRKMSVRNPNVSEIFQFPTPVSTPHISTPKPVLKLITQLDSSDTEEDSFEPSFVPQNK